MEIKRFKPLVDKLYPIIFIPTFVLLSVITVTVCFFPAVFAIIITVFVDFAVVYLLVSPLFGYVELREESVFIKYGLLLKKEIPYSKIRDAVIERKFYSDSMTSLKNAFEHVNIKYNKFDLTTVSVRDNKGFINQLKSRCQK